MWQRSETKMLSLVPSSDMCCGIESYFCAFDFDEFGIVDPARSSKRISCQEVATANPSQSLHAFQV